MAKGQGAKRGPKPKQTEDLPNEVENQEANTSNEFDTDIVNEAVQEKEATEKVTTKEVVTKPVPTAETKQAVHRVLEQKKVNAVPSARDQIKVTFKGVPRTWSSETLKVMMRSYPNDIQINGEPAKLDANGGCCG
jgi:hypothetical protein